MMSNVRGAKLYTAEQIRNSPSRSDGVSEALEKEYRQKTCLFLKAAGKELELPIDAVATATVFFHKFFMLHSFKRHERLFIGSACLFVAAKVEESSKRVELVMSKCWKVWHGGRDPPAENEKAFKRLREKIVPFLDGAVAPTLHVNREETSLVAELVVLCPRVPRLPGTAR